MAVEARLLELTTDIVANHVANNTVALSDIPDLIGKIHATLEGLNSQSQGSEPKRLAVSVRASVKPDYLVCLACGAKKKTLKRHLQSVHGMTPLEYRAEYDLPGSYPMVAASYAERRSELAKSFGLGRKGGSRKKRTTKK